MLDSVKPILFLANGMADDAHHEAIKTALSLLGGAYHSLTDARRRAILRQTSPSFIFLLKIVQISSTTKRTQIGILVPIERLDLTTKDVPIGRLKRFKYKTSKSDPF